MTMTITDEEVDHDIETITTGAVVILGHDRLMDAEDTMIIIPAVVQDLSEDMVAQGLLMEDIIVVLDLLQGISVYASTFTALTLYYIVRKGNYIINKHT